jgi:outer membrane immunogenic protein
MKKFLLGTVGLVALGIAAPAAAADLPARTYTKAPAYIAAVYDWSGFYIGANGGWGQSRDRRLDPAGVFISSLTANGGEVGGQIGYRWQTGTWVIGLEAQGDWADISGSTVVPGFPLATARSRMDAFGLFTGQVGYAWNNALLYVKGGASITDRQYQLLATGGPVVADTGFQTRLGGTVGAGLEYGFTPNWSAAIEYDHIFESRHGVSYNTVLGVPLTGSSAGGDTDLVTARINYRWGGPVVAKY